MHTPLRNPSPDAQRVYFVAEGECSVKRFGAASHGPGPSAALQLDADRNPPAYDSDTVSVLGPLDVFGLEPGGGGRALGSWSVEALTQVKAYYFTLDHFQTLPRAMQKVRQQGEDGAVPACDLLCWKPLSSGGWRLGKIEWSRGYLQLPQLVRLCPEHTPMLK